jgi:hypothetical protein
VFAWFGVRPKKRRSFAAEEAAAAGDAKCCCILKSETMQITWHVARGRGQDLIEEEIKLKED